MSNVIPFITRREYNEVKYAAMEQPARADIFKRRAKDALTELGRFYKSTGYWNESVEREFLQMANSIVTFGENLAGVTPHDDTGRSTKEETGKTEGLSQESDPGNPTTA